MTRTTYILVIAICAAAVGGLFFVLSRQSVPVQAPAAVATAPFDPRNAAYTIEGTRVTLADGVARAPALPGAASETVTRYFGNEANGDVNGDGLADRVFLITQERGGSGVFYYAVAALQSDIGYDITNAVFLGDRIAPQSTDIDPDTLEIHVNHAERRPGEPMTARPSVGVTKYLRVTGGELISLIFSMTMNGYIANIEKLSLENENFRKVLYTDKNSQLVLMSLLAGEEIGEEIHDVDQFLRVEQGVGKAIVNDIPHDITDGSVIIVPAGTKHNIVNSGATPMKLYTLYMPPHHRDGVVHKTKAEGEADATDHFDGRTTE
jgi:mannose-6-phosphate isomerase-like protein (cupin superfamily)